MTQQEFNNGCVNSLIIILLLSMVVGGCLWCSKPSPEQIAVDKQEDMMLEAFVAAKHFVEQRLTSPASAKFPWYDPSYVTPLDNNRFQVKTHVDSANVYGAMLRGNCDVIVRKEEQDWILESIDLQQ